METILKLATVSFATVAYLIIILGIFFKGNTLNAVTWILWTILDLFALYGTWKKGEDLTLLMTFCIGTGLVALLLLIKGQFVWNNTARKISYLVLLCIIVILFGNENNVVWASSIAVFAAGIPYLSELWNKLVVDKSTTTANTLFFLTTLCSVFLAYSTKMSLVFSVTCFMYWIIAMFISLKVPEVIPFDDPNESDV